MDSYQRAKKAEKEALRLMDEIKPMVGMLRILGDELTPTEIQYMDGAVDELIRVKIRFENIRKDVARRIKQREEDEFEGDWIRNTTR
jgi:hypothetical protein